MIIYDINKFVTFYMLQRICFNIEINHNWLHYNSHYHVYLIFFTSYMNSILTLKSNLLQCFTVSLYLLNFIWHITFSDIMFDLHQLIQFRIKKHRYHHRVIKLYPIWLVLFNKTYSTIGHNNAICISTDWVKCWKYIFLNLSFRRIENFVTFSW